MQGLLSITSAGRTARSFVGHTLPSHNLTELNTAVRSARLFSAQFRARPSPISPAPTSAPVSRGQHRRMPATRVGRCRHPQHWAPVSSTAASSAAAADSCPAALLHKFGDRLPLSPPQRIWASGAFSARPLPLPPQVRRSAAPLPAADLWASSARSLLHKVRRPTNTLLPPPPPQTNSVPLPPFQVQWPAAPSHRSFSQHPSIEVSQWRCRHALEEQHGVERAPSSTSWRPWREVGSCRPSRSWRSHHCLPPSCGTRPALPVTLINRFILCLWSDLVFLL